MTSSSSLPLDTLIALSNAAGARSSLSLDQRAALALLHTRSGNYQEAVEVLSTIPTDALAHKGLAAPLARCLLLLGRVDAAINVCSQALTARPPQQGLYLIYGKALAKARRVQEAAAAFERQMREPRYRLEAAEGALLLASASADAGKMLATCDQLPDDLQTSPLARGYRALGLSLAGRALEASTLLDPTTSCRVHAIEPPDGYATIADFNSALAAEILRNPYLRRSADEAFEKTESVGGDGEPACRALLAALRRQVANYLESFSELERQDLFPDIPTSADLLVQANVVRRGQPHRSHLHKYAIVSGVYYVAVPPAKTPDSSSDGAIVLGDISGLVEGHIPAWPLTAIVPQAGDVLLFAPHIFHAVRAIDTDAPRIAVPFDLIAQTSDDAFVA